MSLILSYLRSLDGSSLKIAWRLFSTACTLYLVIGTHVGNKVVGWPL